MLGWGDNGESIVVHDLKALETTVLPLYFRHGNYRSFVRQLNLYEFRKDNNRKLIEYRHPEVRGNYVCACASARFGKFRGVERTEK